MRCHQLITPIIIFLIFINDVKKFVSQIFKHIINHMLPHVHYV